MKTGIVFQLDGRKAIILSSDGTFLTTRAKSGWKIGETVPIPQKQRKHSIYIYACAACLTLFLCSGIFLNQWYASPVAIISLDVNPSIELSINRFDRIVSSYAKNDEGEQILTQAGTKNTSYKKGLEAILNAEEINGYFSADSNVVLTVFASDSATRTKLLSSLQDLIDTKIALYSSEITAEYHMVDEETVTNAHDHGVTAGKYLYMEQLELLDPAADISQYAHHSIEQIKDAIESCTKGHGSNGNGGSHGKKHRKGMHH